jgi:hypothetical protein
VCCDVPLDPEAGALATGAIRNDRADRKGDARKPVMRDPELPSTRRNRERTSCSLGCALVVLLVILAAGAVFHFAVRHFTQPTSR